MMRRIALLLVALILFQVPALGAYRSRTVLFGGDGNDGVLVISGNTTESAQIQKNTQTYTVNASQTHTVKHRSVINCQGTVTINGTLQTAGDFAGGAGNVPAGAGPGGGRVIFGGGGGGGCGGVGGSGGINASGQLAYNGGQAIGLAVFDWGGGGSKGGNAGQPGGAGAGAVKICARGAINIPSGGFIKANGANGTGSGDLGGDDVTEAGGGGGAAGIILLYSQTGIVLNGQLQAQGGNAGAGGVYTGGTLGAGSGGGGIVFRMSPSNTGSGSVSVTAGSTATGGTAGGAGVNITVTGSPNLPLIAAIEKYGGVLVAKARKTRLTEVCMTHREVARIMAVEVAKHEGGNVLDLAFHFLNDRMDETPIVRVIGDFDNANRRAA